MTFAALYAATELILVLTIGRYFDWGRAELLLFHALRPWLLIAAAILMAHHGWRFRIGFYLTALLLAALSQALFVAVLGNSNPLPEALRGIAAGALLLLVADPVLEIGRRLAGRIGLVAASCALALLLLLPPTMIAYERVLIPEGSASSPGAKPGLLLMTGLPIVWGETGAFDPRSRPSEVYTALQREFDVRLLDSLNQTSLTGDLMLLAQPRALAPAELVALDGWVRRGGRLLVLTDPSLLWPSTLPLGDIRRPPAVGLLAPLLGHWGLGLRAGEGRPLEIHDIETLGTRRRLAMAAAGVFQASGASCRVERRWQARCSLGRGEALLVADADLMRDALWVAPLAAGRERHARLADNPLMVMDWLDQLAGRSRNRLDDHVNWLSTGSPRGVALLVGLLPLFLAAAGGMFISRRKRH